MLRAVKPQSRVIVYRRLGTEKKEKKKKKKKRKKEKKKKKKKEHASGFEPSTCCVGAVARSTPPPAPVRVSYRVTLEVDQLSQPFNPRNNALRMIILVSVRITALRIRKGSHWPRFSYRRFAQSAGSKKQRKDGSNASLTVHKYLINCSFSITQKTTATRRREKSRKS